MTADASMEAGSHLEPAFVVPPGLTDAQLWLIRHGETEWSRSGQHTSRTDVPLTANGERQATALRGLLAELRPVFVLCSPRQRAVRTAELAGLTVDAIDDDLVEWDYGQYEGLTTKQIREAVPGWSLWTHPMPGGETPAQVTARADRVLADGLRRGSRTDRSSSSRTGTCAGSSARAGSACARSTVRGWRWTRPRHPSWVPSTTFPSSTGGTCRTRPWRKAQSE